jgi:hypothetical protein
MATTARRGQVVDDARIEIIQHRAPVIQQITGAGRRAEPPVDKRHPRIDACRCVDPLSIELVAASGTCSAPLFAYLTLTTTLPLDRPASM